MGEVITRFTVILAGTIIIGHKFTSRLPRPVSPACAFCPAAAFVDLGFEHATAHHAVQQTLVALAGEVVITSEKSLLEAMLLTVFFLNSSRGKVPAEIHGPRQRSNESILRIARIFATSRSECLRLLSSEALRIAFATERAELLRRDDQWADSVRVRRS